MSINLNLSVDPFILELLPEFIESWISDMGNYKTLLETKNSTDLYRLAHTLKGSCFQFGLNEIAELGVELQGVAKAEDFEKAATYEAKLNEKFLEVKNYLDEQGIK